MIAEGHWGKASKHVNSLAALAAQERGCTTDSTYFNILVLTWYVQGQGQSRSKRTGRFVNGLSRTTLITRYDTALKSNYPTASRSSSPSPCKPAPVSSSCASIGRTRPNTFIS